MNDLHELQAELTLAVVYHLPTPHVAVDIAKDIVQRAREIHYLRIHSKPRSTKHCPKCGSDVLCLLRSQNVKICHECKHEFPWNLDEGQKRLL